MNRNNKHSIICLFLFEANSESCISPSHLRSERPCQSVISPNLPFACNPSNWVTPVKTNRRIKSSLIASYRNANKTDYERKLDGKR